MHKRLLIVDTAIHRSVYRPAFHWLRIVDDADVAAAHLLSEGLVPSLVTTRTFCLPDRRR